MYQQVTTGNLALLIWQNKVYGNSTIYGTLSWFCFLISIMNTLILDKYVLFLQLLSDGISE